MPRASELRDQLLARLPDAPEWIEMQAVLLEPESRLFGDTTGYAVRSDRLRLGGIGGLAPESLIREAFSDIGVSSGAAPSDATGADLWAVVLPEGFTQPARAAFSSWLMTEAFIFCEPEAGLRQALPVPGVDFRLMEPDARSALERLPIRLAGELCSALDRTEVAAAWVDGRPVSFCYCACESRTLWDVSIDTLPEYRRRDLAGATVAFLAGRMRARGKRAVWGAHTPNVASRRLATKLGFLPSGRLFLFENGVIEED